MIEYEKNRSELTDYIYHQEDNNLNFGMHIHKSFEFIYVYSGEINLTIEDKTYSITKGHSALILPNQIHSYATPLNSVSYLCVFSVNYLNDLYEETKNLEAKQPVFLLPENGDIAAKIKESSTRQYALKSIFYFLADKFMQNTDFVPSNNKFRDITSQILYYIENNYTQEISLKQLAKQIGYDYHYMSCVLNKTLNINFLNLVNEYRIHKALKLLLSTDLPVTEIASLSGYDSIRSFNRNFKKYVNSCPKSLRGISYKKI
jgi:AraC-like DNA-binding protein/mannose-6-phosphate isomerase-like protein (cupin superfamily)